MRIAIIGLGLIGGSLGLALKQADWQRAYITGYVRKPETGLLAVKAGAIDSFETTIEKAVSGASFIIVATPILIVKDIFTQLAPYVAHDCIITDVASTKRMVMQWAEDILPASACFIGGHPMAGKELSGIEAAEPGLFRNCTYCLVEGAHSTDRGMSLMQDMIKTIGAYHLLIDAAQHDKFVAGISHLPMLISMALVQTTTKDKTWPQMAKLAASGYRDVTRLASGNPAMHTQICLSNQEALPAWIDTFIQQLQELRTLVANGDTALENKFTSAFEERNEWLKKRYPHQND
jgi:prephenate dehydrogenase